MTRYRNHGNVKMTVAESQNSECKKSVAELEKKVDILEKKMTKLEHRLMDRTCALLLGFLGLVAFFLSFLHFADLVVLVILLCIGILILYLIGLSRSLKSEQSH
jgi:hypothetical protein